MDVNITTIKYDNTLFYFLDLLQIKYNLNKLGSINYVKSAFDDIRNFIHKNTHLLNYTSQDNKSHNKNYFAIFIALISDYRNYNNWEELMIHCYKMEEIPENSYDNDISITCCCGQHISNIHSIQNTLTGKKVIVGCHCVQKNMILNEDIQRQCKKIINRRNKKLKIYKKCKICKEYCMKKEEQYLMCKDCFNIRRGNRLPRSNKCLITIQ